jgi:P27 family predicted phage terminase small subunit
LAKLMNQMGVLTEVDMAAFAAYCQSYARWREAQEHITSGGSTFETDKGYQQQTPSGSEYQERRGNGYSEDREVYRSWRVYYCRSEKW